MHIRTEKSYYACGALHTRHYYYDSRLHRNDGPAVEIFHPDGTPEACVWYNQGKRHRTGGPSSEFFYKDGSLLSRLYYVDDRLHRVDGPARESFFKEQKISFREWFNHGKRHRDDGPAEEVFLRTRNLNVAGGILTTVLTARMVRPLNGLRLLVLLLPVYGNLTASSIA